MGEISDFLRQENDRIRALQGNSQIRATEDRDFGTEPITRRQRRSFRGAQRETRRVERQLRGKGFGEDVDKALEDKDKGVMHTMSTLTQPVFDFLQIGQFVTAGAALEIQKKGLGWTTFTRAASEALNALPGIDEERAESITGIKPTRPSFADVLDKEGAGPWSAATGGFLLDVILDPTTYLGVGLGARLAKAGYKGFGFLDTATPFNALKKISQHPRVEKLVMEAGKTEGWRSGYGVGGSIGRAFLPHFEKRQFVRENPLETRAEAAASVERIIDARRQFDIELDQGKIEVRDLALSLSENMTWSERRMVTAYLSEPDRFRSLLKQAAPERFDELMEKADAIRKTFDNYWELDNKTPGLYAPTPFIENYVPGREALTGISQKSMDDLFDRMGIEAQRRNHKAIDLDRGGQIDQGYAVFNKKKTYDDPLARIASGVGTEMDIISLVAQRGFESVRWRANKRLANTILNDPNIATSIPSDISIAIRVVGKDGDATLKSVEELIEEGIDEKVAEKISGKAATQIVKWSAQNGYGMYRPLRTIVHPEEPLGNLSKSRQFNKDGNRYIVQGIDEAKDVKVRKIIKNKPSGSPEKMSYTTQVTPFRGKGKQRKTLDNIDLGKVQVGQNFADELGNEFKVIERGRQNLIKIKNLTQKKARAQKLSPNEMVKPIGAEPSWLLPKPFIRELDTVHKVYSGDDTEFPKWAKKVITLQNLWKGYAVLSPGFHARNMYSNWFNNFLGGVQDPRDYFRATRLQMGKGDDIALEMADGTVIKGESIMDLAKKYGILRGGIVTGEVGQDIQREFMLTMGRKGKRGREIAANITDTGVDAEFIKNLIETTQGRDIKAIASLFVGQNNPLLKANRIAGHAIENNARLAHFVKKINGGMMPSEAAASVRKYLFDYSALTPTEQKWMKNVIPFYSWMRFNTPLMFQAILENPGKFAAMTGKPIQAIESISKDWKDLPTPDYFQEIHAVRLPKGAAELLSFANREAAKTLGDTTEREGTQPVYLNPNFPFQDLNRLNFQDILSGLSPVIKVPIEMVAGEQGRGFSFFLDRPIESFPEEPADVSVAPGVDMRLRQKTETAIRTALPTYGKIQRFRERANKGQVVSQLLTEFLGVKAISVDVDRVKRGKTYDRRRKLRQIKKRYEKLGQF